MNTFTLARKVAHMRDAQKQYFTLSAQAKKNKALYPKAKEILVKSKALEKEVDETCLKIFSEEKREETRFKVEPYDLYNMDQL